MTTNRGNPLTEGYLEGAAYLCLESAAFTNLDQPLPGFGEIYRRKHHERKRRFEKALTMVKGGATSLLEIGLLPGDCNWAAGMANRARDPEEWKSRFQAAERMLLEAT